MNEIKIRPPGTLFIALSGKKQVGKDLSAKIIASFFKTQNKSVAITAFAEPLKRMCIEILGLKEEEVYGTDAQKNTLSHILWDGFSMDIRLKYSDARSQHFGFELPRSGPMTNREVLQVMGTDIFRSIYGDVWATAPFKRKWNEDVVILTDCRFLNEKLATEETGGVIIRLERETDFKDNHPSETALDNVYFKNKYINNGSLIQLENYLMELINGI